MRFYPGLEFSHAGVQYRIVPGNRCSGDMILECRQMSEWLRPRIAHTFIPLECKFQVEENNYGKNGKIKRGAGSFYLFRRLSDLHNGEGWEKIAKEIEGQRAALKREVAA